MAIKQNYNQMQSDCGNWLHIACYHHIFMAYYLCPV